MSINIEAPQFYQTSLMELLNKMILNDEIKTDIISFNKFMFSFANYQEKFPIHWDLLIEWKAYDTKGEVRNLLFEHFYREVDYIYKNRQIFLSMDCFKTLCMLSNNEVGNQIRQYYLDLDKVFEVFTNQQQENKLKKI